MYLAVRHSIRYKYSAPVTENLMELRLLPMTDETQRCVKFRLTVTPRAQLHHIADCMGNSLHFFDVPSPHGSLAWTAEAVVETEPEPVLPERLSPTGWGELAGAAELNPFWELVQPSPGVSLDEETLKRFRQEGLPAPAETDPLTYVRSALTTVQESLRFDPLRPPPGRTLAEALEQGSGTCQDFAHGLLTLVRCAGIPGRFVTGYFYQRAEDRVRTATDTLHAWVEVYLPDLGWIGLDPTTGQQCGERHIRVAYGRDALDVPCMKGVFRGEAESTLTGSVKVRPSSEPLGEETGAIDLSALRDAEARKLPGKGQPPPNA